MTKNYNLETCENYTKEGDDVYFTAGDMIFEGKNRCWLLLKGDDWDSTFQAAKQLGDTICTKFTSGCFAIIHKDKDMAFKTPEGFTMMAATKCKRLGALKVVEVLKTFFHGPHKANVTKKEKRALPAWSEMQEFFMNFDTPSFIQYLAEAKLAKKEHRLSQTQEAALVVATELKDYIKTVEISNEMVKDVVERTFTYPDEMMKLPKLVGLHYEEGKGIFKITFDEANVKTDLHLRKAIILAGFPGSGKSSAVRSVAKMQAEAYGYTRYVFGKALDPFGCLAKSGGARTIGAVAVTDLDMVSAANEKLSIEEMKGIFKVDEQAAFRARYFPGQMPEMAPRLFAVNSENKDQWFLDQGLEGCAALARNDLAALKSCNQHQRAAARSVVIFHVQDFLFEKTPESMKRDPVVQKFLQRK